jgi:hypothetical protein
VTNNIVFDISNFPKKDKSFGPGCFKRPAVSVLIVYLSSTQTFSKFSISITLKFILGTNPLTADNPDFPRSLLASIQHGKSLKIENAFLQFIQKWKKWRQGKSNITLWFEWGLYRNKSILRFLRFPEQIPRQSEQKNIQTKELLSFLEQGMNIKETLLQNQKKALVGYFFEVGTQFKVEHLICDKNKPNQ